MNSSSSPPRPSIKSESDRRSMRYSDHEKNILYYLFKQYVDIIDIKHRRNNKNYKMTEVRECWQKILKEFNEHQGTTERNLKQIQKFWLNSRLRMRNASSDGRIRMKNEKKYHSSEYMNEQYTQNNYTINSNHSDRIDYDSTSNQTKSEDDEEEDDEEEEEEEEDDDGDDTQDGEKQRILKQEQIEQETKYDKNEENAQQEDSVDVKQIHHINHRITNRNSIKNTRLSDASSASNRNNQTQSPNNQVLSHHHHHHHQNSQIIHTFQQASNIILQQPPQQQSNQQISSSHTPRPADSPVHLHTPNPYSNHQLTDTSQFETQMNILRLQEYETRIKESQLRCDQQRIDIMKAQEELEHLKEMNRLKVREMQLKIHLLEEQSKLRTRQNNNN